VETDDDPLSVLERHPHLIEISPLRNVDVKFRFLDVLPAPGLYQVGHLHRQPIHDPPRVKLFHAVPSPLACFLASAYVPPRMARERRFGPEPPGPSSGRVSYHAGYGVP